MGKVLIYILTEGRGGVEEYVMNLSRFCDNPSLKYGYLIMGEKTIYEDELKFLGVSYHFIPKKNKVFSNIKAYRKLLKKLRQEYEAIYFNTSGLYYPIPYYFARKFNYRIILHSHSTIGPMLKKPIHYLNRKWINKICNVKLACSTPAGKWMFGNKEIFLLIPNAIELERFRFNESNREKCRKQYRLADSFVIGNIGRLHPVKNQIFLIDILKALIDKKKDVKLLLVGDGNMKADIENRAKKLHVQDRVIFAGQTRTPEYYYSAMDCFVIPSFVEGFPITLIEAQANGLPCIASDTVTDETNITGNVHYLPINGLIDRWCSEITENIRYENGIEVLRENNYDVAMLESKVSKFVCSDGDLTEK